MSTKIFQEIKRTLREIELLYNNDNFIKQDFKDYFMVKLKLGHRIKQDIFSFVIPKNENFNNSEFIGKEEYIIVDIFENKKNSNSISSKDFFFSLFNLEHYEDFIMNPAKYRLGFEDVREDKDWIEIKEKYICRKNVDLVHNINLKEEFKDELDVIDYWQAPNINTGPLLILGTRGIGKTWYLKKFCYNQYKKFEQNPWIVPPAIYINLRILKNNKEYIQDISDAIRFYVKKYKINLFDDYNIFYGFFRANKIILVLDGLDEVSLEINQNILSKNIWDILTLTKHSNQLILSSRSNLFDNSPQLFKYFAISRYLNLTQKEKIRLVAGEDKIRVDFNIIKLGYFTDNEIQQLIDANLAKENPNEYALIKHKLGYIASNKNKSFIEREIYDLSKIAEFGNFFIKNDNKFLFDAYEKSIENLVFEFNIEHGRAVYNKKSLNIETQTISNEPFDKYIKYERIQKLAWVLFDSKLSSFKINNLPYRFTQLYPSLLTDEVTLNDLKTQTVLDNTENPDIFQFISDGVFSYFIALHVFSLFASDSLYIENYKLSNTDITDYDMIEIIKNNQSEGIKILGRNNLLVSNVRVLQFLKEKIALESNDEIDYFQLIKDLALDILNDIEYTPWSRYLSQNLKALGIECEKIDIRNPWIQYPIDFSSKDRGKYYIYDRLVYIPESELEFPNNVKQKTDHFFISETEITNRLFRDFINKCDQNEFLKGEFWKRNGKYWQNIENPYNAVINDYHLLLWPDGKCPDKLLDHPVVYISWFSATQFCNWLSYMENIEPFYIFDFELVSDQDGNKIKVPLVSYNNNSFGYRLPKIREWELVEMEGSLNNVKEKIWDRVSDPIEKEQIKKEFYRTKLDTFPVKSSKENKYGLFGMIHNVREWVDWGDHKDKLVKWKDMKPFLGSTWLLGDEGANYFNRHKIMAQNTNIDQGFRIARSLSPEEEKNVEKALKIKKS